MDEAESILTALGRLMARIEKLEQATAKDQSLPKRYRDVTAECEMERSVIMHRHKDERAVAVLGPGCGLFDGYRLRKVHVAEVDPCSGLQEVVAKVAFIIEKEES